ncbi:MAG: phosphatase PAP2 family protein [Raineya sp.]|jgi:undecaprenyl-diphosphatase|nr:phosphatase PAP2 family protein [Raineya sp.]
MLETIDAWDKSVVLWVNEMHNPTADFLMKWASHTGIWIPFYGLLLYLLIRVYGRKSVFYIVGITLVVVLSDQITSSFMKPFFERLRPCHVVAWENVLHLPAGCGGKYGFASSHAANTFGLAMFWWLVLRKQYRFIYPLFGWAGVVSFSRIYLAAHYPTDVIVGGLVGVLSAYIVYKIPEKIFKI